MDGNLNLSNSIVFNGDVDQYLSGAELTALKLQKVTIDKPFGDVILGTDVEITESLTFEKGNISTGDNRLLLDYSTQTPEIINAGSDGDIIGNLEVSRDVSTAGTIFGFAGLSIGEGEDDLGIVKVIRSTGPDAVISTGESESIQRSWEVMAGAPLMSERVFTFSWTEAEDNGMALEQVKVWQETENADEWVALNPEFQDGSSRSVTATTARLSRFTIANEENPLPVSLISFTATLQDNGALLAWATASEYQNAGFNIQKSRDGKHFFGLGFIPGKGNSVIKHQYKYIDATFDAASYYRLEQIDYNGNSAYSPIRFLARAENQQPSFEIYPNPISSWLKIKSPGDLTPDYFQIYSVQGTVIFKEKPATTAIMEKRLNHVIPELPSGLYFLKVFYNKKIDKIRFVKN